LHSKPSRGQRIVTATSNLKRFDLRIIRRK